MLHILKEIKRCLPALLEQYAAKGLVKTMMIDYHQPFVKRIWFEHKGYRVFLHKIIYTVTETNEDALFHPHRWHSAMEILKGSYEMGIGHSATNDVPPIDCKIILPEGSVYEMVEKDAWHYVKPTDPKGCFTLMVAGGLNGRKEMPIESDKVFRPLRALEVYEILRAFNFGERPVNRIDMAYLITGEKRKKDTLL